jgi:hypothetical protein
MLEFVVVRGDVENFEMPHQGFAQTNSSRTADTQPPYPSDTLQHCSLVNSILCRSTAETLRDSAQYLWRVDAPCQAPHFRPTAREHDAVSAAQSSFYASCDTYSVAFRHANSRAQDAHAVEAHLVHVPV